MDEENFQPGQRPRLAIVFSIAGLTTVLLAVVLLAVSLLRQPASTIETEPTQSMPPTDSPSSTATAEPIATSSPTPQTRQATVHPIVVQRKESGDIQAGTLVYHFAFLRYDGNTGHFTPLLSDYRLQSERDGYGDFRYVNDTQVLVLKRGKVALLNLENGEEIFLHQNDPEKTGVNAIVSDEGTTILVLKEYEYNSVATGQLVVFDLEGKILEERPFSDYEAGLSESLEQERFRSSELYLLLGFSETERTVYFTGSVGAEYFYPLWRLDLNSTTVDTLPARGQNLVLASHNRVANTDPFGPVDDQCNEFSGSASNPLTLYDRTTLRLKLEGGQSNYLAIALKPDGTELLYSQRSTVTGLQDMGEIGARCKALGGANRQFLVYNLSTDKATRLSGSDAAYTTLGEWYPQLANLRFPLYNAADTQLHSQTEAVGWDNILLPRSINVDALRNDQ